MPKLNWGLIQDGGAFESLMHAILYTEDAGTVLFGRPGKDAGEDARSADGTQVFQAKYRQQLTMDGAVHLALDELKKIKEYRQPDHQNYRHWQNTSRWILVANFSINPNDHATWQDQVVRAFQDEGLIAEYWSLETLERKLETHQDLRNDFFGGENRVLVGLKEAHDLLDAACIGSASLAKPLVGREAEMQIVSSFAASDDKRVLPIIGPPGIGKSRLLYESLVQLAEDGWRVFWALPETMTRSSRCFHLLNGSQRTCVAIDDPNDPSLLRAVNEQLAAVERRNWKVIVACRSHKAQVLRGVATHRHVSEALTLGPLDESESKCVLRNSLLSDMQDPWLHSVHIYTQGVPGWLCLTAELANRGALETLPLEIDEVAANYVESCLQSLTPNQRDAARTLLRWLALWGTLRLGSNDEAELRFLDGLGIPDALAREMLRKLVQTGLVRNWGVDKRLYAIEPLILQEHILSDWLLQETNGVYEVNTEGRGLVERLVKGAVPSVDRVLNTLAHLTQWRLDEPEGFAFLKPIFDEMARLANNGNLLDQYRCVELVEQAGAADPESALDVLTAIRENPKPDTEVGGPPWGTETLTHSSLVSKLPSTLYGIACYVDDDTVARRCLAEFRELIYLEKEAAQQPASDKGARERLKILLCRSRNWSVYAQPASEAIQAGLEEPTSWPFVRVLLKSLLNPQREFTECVAKWTITIVRRPSVPGGPGWNLATDLRAQLFDLLKRSEDTDLRPRMWRVLSGSHHQHHRMVLYAELPTEFVPAYRSVLFDDLRTCAEIIESPPIPLTIEEATHAREMWSWYLRYGRDGDPVDLARRCETAYERISQWRLHDFFRFETDEVLAPETERVAAILRAASGVETFEAFFVEAARYLVAARQGGRDGADWNRVSILADTLVTHRVSDELFASDSLDMPLTAYVLAVLRDADEDNLLAWHFALRVVQKHLRHLKEVGDEAVVADRLRWLLRKTRAKGRFLFDLFSCAHPASLGKLTTGEFSVVVENKETFSASQWFILLGIFATVAWETVRSHLSSRLEEMRAEAAETSTHMASFIRALHLSVLRYDWPSLGIPTEWIITAITDHGLDGALLEMHELTWLRDKSGFKLTMAELVALLRSRIALEENSGRSHGLQVMPHDFHITEWCSFDEGDPEDLAAFHEFCLLALGSGFAARYWMPKYLARLDPSGRHVGSFVEQHLRENPSIDTDALTNLAHLSSAYPDTSEAWTTVAMPICEVARRMRREERQHVYFGLARKETEVITSTPGVVADHYVRRLDEAARLRDAEPLDSPLRECREWALRRAQRDLEWAAGRAEEDARD